MRKECSVAQIGDGRGKPDQAKLDRIVAQARRQREERERGYREQSLKIHGWICARCGRDFTSATVHQLTVHHKDGNHDNNPPDGSNWENLCIYCHENEHSRELEYRARGGEGAEGKPPAATHNPFAGLKEMLEKKKP
jgi:5-methylcytosine-specific restriction endonuclease McrA